MDYLAEAKAAAVMWQKDVNVKSSSDAYYSSAWAQALAFVAIAEDIRKMRELFETRCPVLGISARPAAPAVILGERKVDG